ncbi:hypothetical protein [Flavimaricola marinus]|uniref:Uncharacterized protein n=1 Tax=Flavimaricola marinus TaxID=1819565 RepID=A0A238LJU1_9RHOB|nr:hypothetical protein [Flavimaricola marinus]SMY09226.1 hypothetical protein LOM8899_03391 [Flavimaricola marinus]
MPDLAQAVSAPATDDETQPAHRANAALRLQVMRQNTALDGLAGRLEEQTTQIATLAGKLRDSDARIVALTQDAQTLRQEVAALRASNSWRITAPFRGLRRAFWWVQRRWGGRA